jgi:hypothetical protein
MNREKAAAQAAVSAIKYDKMNYEFVNPVQKMSLILLLLAVQ